MTSNADTKALVRHMARWKQLSSTSRVGKHPLAASYKGPLRFERGQTTPTSHTESLGSWVYTHVRRSIIEHLTRPHCSHHRFALLVSRASQNYSVKGAFSGMIMVRHGRGLSREVCWCGFVLKAVSHMPIPISLVSVCCRCVVIRPDSD